MKWLFILSGLIACTGKPVSSSCPIQMSPPMFVVRFGGSFSVNCTSSSDQILSMGWEAIYGRGIGRKDRVSSVVLTIDDVKDWFVEPQCYINLRDRTQCSGNMPVTVYKLPDSVSLSHPNQMGPLVEGETYRMQCDIVNVAPVRNLSVSWLKGDDIIYTETFDGSSLSPVNKSSVFNLTAQRGDNGAAIRCRAELDFSPPVPHLRVESKAHDVIVLYSPTFTKPENETLKLSAGSNIVLDCTATGNPSPVYSWHFPQPVQQTEKNPNENQTILTPLIQFPGTYNCTASNTQGTKTKYFTVVEAAGNRTTFAALVGGFVALAALLFIGGLFFVTPEGTFSFSKGNYLKGRPTSSGPV